MSKDPRVDHSWLFFIKSSMRTGLLFTVLGIISWLAGIPFLWPSLGPTAYILAFDRDKNHPFKKVMGAHTIAAIAGWATHQLFAPRLTMAVINHPVDPITLNITLSAITALAITTGLMRATGWTHSPACATTLIVALGLITGAEGIAFILGAVILLYIIHFLNEILFKRIGWISDTS